MMGELAWEIVPFRYVLPFQLRRPESQNPLEVGKVTFTYGKGVNNPTNNLSTIRNNLWPDRP